jgi:HAD superfamily hydrolase (TIGR01490 family)
VASDDHADHTDDPPAAPGVAERADVVAAATAAAAERGDEAERTEERYARPDADRLSDAALAAIAARSTGSEEAAFFDLDKTIIARSSTLVMGRTFFKDGLISPSTVLKGLYAQAVYQLVGADHAKMEQMRRAALDLTQGWDADRVRKLVRETVEEVIAPLVYAEALALIEQHHDAGRDVWIVSSSGEEIVEPFAGYLGVEEILATRSGIDDEGRYDGTLEFYAYAGAKATAMRQVADARGYDLTRCYAYSDSITDLPMLSAVGHPTAVNPDRELRAAAVAMGWDTRDFTAPVRLRDRLPAVERKRDKAVVGLVLAAAIGAIAWRVLGDDEGASDERL